MYKFYSSCGFQQGDNSNVGLALRIGLSTWTKLDGYSYSYLPCYYAKVSPLHYVL